MWPRGDPTLAAQAWQAWAQTVLLPSWVPCPSRCGGGAGSDARIVGYENQVTAVMHTNGCGEGATR